LPSERSNRIGNPSYFQCNYGFNPIVAYGVASGWRKPAGFPPAGTLARGVGKVTFGENR